MSVNQSSSAQSQSQKALEEAQKKDAEFAAGQNGAAAGEQPGNEPPEKTANDQLGTTGETDAEKIAKAIDAIVKVNPDLSIGEVTAIVASAFKKQESPDMKVAKEAARLIPPPPDRDFKKKVYLKKDKDRKFPIDESALKEDCYIGRQTYKRQTEEGDEVVVPARNLNEFAIYSEEEFARLSLPGQGFEREGVTFEVWHKPGQKDTVQED